MHLLVPVNSLLSFLAGLILAVFCKNRFDAYRQDPSNRIVYRYFLASFFVMIALILFGLPSLITRDQNIISFFILLGTIFNAIGFNNFFIITLYSWFPPKAYVLIKYAFSLFIAALTLAVVVVPPMPFIDSYNVFHFGFSQWSGWLAALQMDIVFIGNVFLILNHYYRLRQLSILNTMALVITYIVAGASGSYQYIGDSTLGLYLSGVALYLGISFVSYTVIRGQVNRMISWQTRKEE